MFESRFLYFNITKSTFLVTALLTNVQHPLSTKPMPQPSAVRDSLDGAGLNLLLEGARAGTGSGVG